ncbi:MAG: hypothetical protein HQM06_02920 [Magnetococcales bacterium]|nr:hypothetical protein [Magnetococcales bacterium]
MRTNFNVRIYILSLLILLCYKSALAESGPVCNGESGPPIGWNCPDLPVAEEGDWLESTVLTSRIVRRSQDDSLIKRELCSFANRIKNWETRKNHIPYNPFLLELQGKNGKTWSVHAGCFVNKLYSREVLQEARKRVVRADHCQPTPDEQCPYPLRSKSKTVKEQLNKNNLENTIAPGRGLRNVSDQDKQPVFKPLRVYLRTSKSNSHQNTFKSKDDILKTIAKVLCSGDQNCERKMSNADNWKEQDVNNKVIKTKKHDLGEILLTSIEYIPLSTEKLHSIASMFTKCFRNKLLVCSEAVVIRTRKDELPAIRICQFYEDENKCRCPVMEIGNDSY